MGRVRNMWWEGFATLSFIFAVAASVFAVCTIIAPSRAFVVVVLALSFTAAFFAGIALIVQVRNRPEGE